MISLPPARRIVHAELPIVKSPSGLPTQHLVSSVVGSRSLFVAQQWLQPGERVLLHTHPVEESLTFLAGEGLATLGDDEVAVGPGITLYVPPGVVHGFACTAGQLHVLFAFSTHEFADTVIVEEPPIGREPV
jgi:quercetin dioxygenase-like cupin family protein